MKRLLLIFTALAALLAVSCQKEENPEGKQTSTIHFANVREAFTQGTQFGLFAGEPINKTNLKLTVDSLGALVPEDSLCWGQGQKSTSSFLCYTPYDKDYTGTSATFKVKEDQSVKENATASDLMCAVTSAAPSDASVNFKFEHKMSTAKFYFDNKVNSKITKVELNDVYTSCTFSLTSGEVSSPADKETISCYDNGDYWQAVFVPQSIKLTIKVTLANGNEYIKEAAAEQTFESGKVYSTDQNPIVIEDSSAKAINLVFSVSDWADGGQLNFNGGEEGEYTTLADLAATAGSSAKTFNDVTVKNVVVTKVYGNNVHIEDATAALLVYMSGHGLSEGDCINGKISGKIQLYDGYSTVQDESKAYAELTSIDYSKATVTTVEESAYPLTVATIAQFIASPKTYYNRRVKFESVTVDTGVSSSVQSGKISQSGSSIVLFNKSKQAVIETGDCGDLTGFPTIYRGTLQALVYTTDQFTSKGSGEDSPFTRLSLYGCYSSTDSESPVAVRTYEKTADQISYSKSSSARDWKLFNMSTGKYLIVNLPTASIASGAEIKASVNTDGTVESRTVTVVKKTSTGAWLEDKTNHIGYVIALQ